MNIKTELPAHLIYQQSPNIDDEIEISELFNKIWNRRLFIVAFVFTVGVITLGVLSMQLLIDPPEKRYSEILRFNFPEAEKGLYPSGQLFSYNDIVSAKVLARVYKKNDLISKNIKFDRFSDSILINPFSENADFIKKKYLTLLANKKLTRPEIDSLEKTYLDELSAAQARFVRLSLIDPGYLGLDEIAIQKILMDIPLVWSKVAIEELGVLDLKVASADFYQVNQIDRFEYVQTLEYLQESSKYLEGALKLIIKDPVGGLVRSPISGKSGYDVLVQLKNLMNFEIQPLFSTVTNLGISRDADKALIYLKNTIQNLQDEKEVLVKKAENFKATINQYVSNNIGTKATKQEAAMGGFAQYDSTFLDKFTTLIEEKNDKVFTQDLLNKRLTALQDIENIEGDIIKFQRAEKRLLSSTKDISKQVRTDVIHDIALVKKNFEILVDEYKGLLAAHNQQVLGNNASLYQITSHDVLVETNLISRLKTDFMISFLAAFVALMIAVIISLARKSPVKTEQSNTSVSVQSTPPAH
jgi:hypothetical protein